MGSKSILLPIFSGDTGSSWIFGGIVFSLEKRMVYSFERVCNVQSTTDVDLDGKMGVSLTIEQYKYATGIFKEYWLFQNVFIVFVEFESTNEESTFYIWTDFLRFMPTLRGRLPQGECGAMNGNGHNSYCKDTHFLLNIMNIQGEKECFAHQNW